MVTAVEVPRTAAAPQRADCVWERQQKRLWVGRRDGRVVGMVEGGRRFTALDENCSVVGRFRSFEAACLASAGVPATDESIEDASPSGRLLVAGFCGGAGAALVTALAGIVLLR